MPGVQLVKRVALKKKEVDDVLGGDEAWANVQKTDGGLINTGELAGSLEGRACCMHGQHAPVARSNMIAEMSMTMHWVSNVHKSTNLHHLTTRHSPPLLQ